MDSREASTKSCQISIASRDSSAKSTETLVKEPNDLKKDGVKKKKYLLYRLHILTGYVSVRKIPPTNKIIVKLWAIFFLFLYIACIFMIVQMLRRYLNKKAITIAEDIQPNFHFPAVLICHTGNFNKTYFQENVYLSPEVLKKGKDLDITQAQLLGQFARYISLFNDANMGAFEEKLWALLGDIYDDNFKDIHFSDFISHATLRGDEVFRKCEFGGRRFKCKTLPILMQAPSCYGLTIERNYEAFSTSKANMNAGLKFEIALPRKHVFTEWSDDAVFSIDQLGVSVTIGQSPSPYDTTFAFPGNTHAILEVQSTHVAIKSNCYNPPYPKLTQSLGVYSRDTCIWEVIQNVTKISCDCYIASGVFFPRNDEICTPKKIKECVGPNVFDHAMEFDSPAGQEMKYFCKPKCDYYTYDSTVSYYNIENEEQESDREFMTNKFSIFYDSKRIFSKTERSLITYYEMMANVGEILAVFAGLSALSVLHDAVLIFNAICVACWRFCVSVLCGKYLQHQMPFAAVPNNRQRNKNRIFRVTRVEPMQTI